MISTATQLILALSEITDLCQAIHQQQNCGSLSGYPCRICDKLRDIKEITTNAKEQVDEDRYTAMGEDL